MDKEQLLELRGKAEDNFSALDKRREDDLAEMHRIQGEYRLINKLLETPEKSDDNEEIPAE